MTTETQQPADGGGEATSDDTLTVTDNRTGKQYEIPIEDGTIRATELRKIKVDDDDFGLMTYDPAYMATASCRSAITFIDGEKGILEYRGYPIEQLAEKSELPRGRLPADPRRAAHREAARATGTTRSRSTRSCTRTSRSSCRASATTPTRWGCCWRRSARSRPSTPRRAIKDEEAALHAGHPAAGQDADAVGVLLPPQPRHALRLSRQRPQLRRATSCR